MDRRHAALPTNDAALATYGDVVLAGALLDAAWADYRAGRLALDEVFVWQGIHRAVLGHYIRLIAGGLDDGSDFRADRAVGAGLPGPRGVGSVAGQAVTCPRCHGPLVGDWCPYCRYSVDYRAHAPIIPQPVPGVNTSEDR